MKWASARELLQFVVEQRLLCRNAEPSLLRDLEHRMLSPRLAAAALQGLDLISEYQAQMLAAGRKSDLVFGPYRLIDRLSSNSISRVFRARDLRTDQEVALKVLTVVAHTSKEIKRRFEREVLVARRMHHPNIVRTLEAHLSETAGYVVMEFMPGTDLQRILERQEFLPISRACDFVRQTALGLQHAHEHGLVHRDIKPANLLVFGNSIKILDFGLVRLMVADETGGSKLTALGSMLGTADYMSPEQAQDPSTVDIRSDIYSLGCTLYHALSGAPPFAGGQVMKKLFRHQQEEPAPLIDKRLGVSMELDAVVRRMLQKQPQNRFASPVEVAQALERLC